MTRKSAAAVDTRIAQLARSAALAALDKQASDVVVLNVSALTSYADYFIICTGRSTQHVSAVADEVEDRLRAEGKRPLGVEGRSSAHWVLMDYGDMLVHVFEPETREFYDLEGLWLDAPRMELPEAVEPAAAG